MIDPQELVWGGSPHKCCLSLVVDWLRTVAVQWLSAMFIVVICFTDRTPTDWHKPSQPQRFGAVLSRLRAGRTRLSAGCVRLCAGYNGRALAGAGGHWRYTEAPPRGDCDRAHTYNRLQKFLSEFEEVYPVLSIYRQYSPDNPDHAA
jgi:hypothetical protein